MLHMPEDNSDAFGRRLLILHVPQEQIPIQRPTFRDKPLRPKAIPRYGRYRAVPLDGVSDDISGLSGDRLEIAVEVDGRHAGGLRRSDRVDCRPCQRSQIEPATLACPCWPASS